MVEVVVWAVALEDEKWNMKRARERTISEEQRLLSLVRPPAPINL
jgi:hypothetical protein